LFQPFILKGYAEVLTVKSEGKRPFIHIQKDPKDALALEGLAILWAHRIRVVSELAYPKEGPTVLVITICCFLVHQLLRRYSNL